MAPTLQALYNLICSQLAALNCSLEQQQAEAELLLQHVAGTSKADMLRDPKLPVPEAKIEVLKRLLARRIENRTPIQYLLGEAWFYGLRLTVTPAVLIPRPETELLVEKALPFLQAKPTATVLDLCTGSGCIALALAANTPPSVSIVASDICDKALEVAKNNAYQLGLIHKIAFTEGSMFIPFAGQRFDCIVSNPPYICPSKAPTLAPEVIDHEPALALFSGDGPLAFYQCIAAEAPNHLNFGGVVIAELGEDCASGCIDIFRMQGFDAITVLDDYGGHPRVLMAHWPGTPNGQASTTHKA